MNAVLRPTAIAACVALACAGVGCSEKTSSPPPQTPRATAVTEKQASDEYVTQLERQLDDAKRQLAEDRANREARAALEKAAWQAIDDADVEIQQLRLAAAKATVRERADIEADIAELSRRRDEVERRARRIDAEGDGTWRRFESDVRRAIDHLEDAVRPPRPDR